jgi:20S proteasome alpha/beta subunit
MTLVAGFTCRDGLLICADMEEVGVGASKRKINKLFYRDIGGVQVVFTGAGSSAVIDNAIQRMDDALRGRGAAVSYDAKGIQDLIDSTLLTVYEKYVWPNRQNDHSINMLVAYSHGLEQKLWITHDTVTTPEVRYACAGIGQDLANYFADRLYHPQYSESQMVLLATAIFREVKRNVTGVGQGTQMWMLRRMPPSKFYNYPEIDIIENTLPTVDGALYQYGKGLTGSSVFPLLPFTLDVPNVELCYEPEGQGKGYLTGPSIHAKREIKRLDFK